MATISVDDETLSVEVVAAETDCNYYIRVEYDDSTGSRQRTEWQLEVDSRSELTVDRIEQILTEWTSSRDDVASLTSFSIQRVDIARRGTSTTDEASSGTADNQPIDPATATSRFPYSPGDRIAYYVDGPDSTVYGYTTEAVVTELPPIQKQNREPIRGKVEIDTGADTKVIPDDWIVGPAADVTVDKPNDRL
ncbi:hypothetical protein BV210_18610 (plasmid) [Halorientalis sp. IM1011]|uniref:hypothetical protein n=1 Tax=Halorientalis sp. IM1011 TaxID=1932360 RepID=UPI00097CCBF5|nr:hypothetical protein [Halorientalis sp. IM1011]AQL44762.1 hypothetical protein BV210_18610 [Halorientalis sp. IM1011]